MIRPSGSPNCVDDPVERGDRREQVLERQPVPDRREGAGDQVPGDVQPGHLALDPAGGVGDHAGLGELVVDRLAVRQQGDEALDQVRRRCARPFSSVNGLRSRITVSRWKPGSLVRVLGEPAQQRLLDQLEDLADHRLGEGPELAQQRERPVDQRRQVVDQVAAGSSGEIASMTSRTSCSAWLCSAAERARTGCPASRRSPAGCRAPASAAEPVPCRSAAGSRAGSPPSARRRSRRSAGCSGRS